MLDPDTTYERRWYALGVLCLSLLVISVDNSILNVALPTIVRELGATGSDLQWIVDAYVIVFACLLLTAGALGDKFGRRGALSFGLIMFGACSALASFATTPGMLVAARGLMGIGAAFIFPTTLSILTNTFTGSERARAIGVWAGVTGLGIAIGPTVGGLLVENFSWGAVFLINVPICLAALVLGHFFVPTSRDPENRALDPVGAGLSIIALVGLLYAIIQAPTLGWTATPVVGSFVVGLLFLSLFAVWELRTSSPMLDLRVFENPRFSAASSVITLSTFALFGAIFLLTQYFQFVLGYSPLKSGILSMPVAVGLMVTAPNAPKLVSRWGTKNVVVLGLGINAIGLLLFASNTIMSTLVGGALVRGMVGVGVGFTSAPATESIMGSLPPSRAGVGSAVNDTTRQVGGAMGIAVLGSTFLALYHHFVAHTTKLSGVAAAGLHDSVGSALSVARRLPHEQAVRVVDVARGAFIDAMRLTYPIAAAVVLMAALIAWRFLPARARHEFAPISEQIEPHMTIEVPGSL
jgi:EmrB/QacA subfamily drug resistance transporter